MQILNNPTSEITLFACSPSWDDWIHEQQMALQQEEQEYLDHQRQLELYPFEEIELETIEIEIAEALYAET